MCIGFRVQGLVGFRVRTQPLEEHHHRFIYGLYPKSPACPSIIEALNPTYTLSSTWGRVGWNKRAAGEAADRVEGFVANWENLGLGSAG